MSRLRAINTIRPPGNRDPLPEELNACAGYLDGQIEAIDPCVIVTLGRFSMAKFLPNSKISDIHGQASMIHGRLIVPMFHPAAALHQPSLKPLIITDFKQLPKALEQVKKGNKKYLEPETAKTETPVQQNEDSAEQLSLF